MDRHALAARVLKVDGILLLVVAAIHLVATPLALNFISSQPTAAAYAQIKPPFLLSFVVVGILLIPVGSTFFCSDSLCRGESWARTICCFNAVSVLAACPSLYHAPEVFPSDTIPRGHYPGLDRRHLDGIPAISVELQNRSFQHFRYKPPKLVSEHFPPALVGSMSDIDSMTMSTPTH